MTPEQMTIKQTAVAFSWRLIYEGLGLSGYSLKATAAMKVIDCAKSDSEKGWRVAQKINSQDAHVYDYAFKVGEELPPSEWRIVSGPSELVRLLGGETKITVDIAKELIKSAAILRCYKKIESEGLVSISEKSGYFKYVNDAVVQGSLRRIGQGSVGEVADYDDFSDPEYDPATAPGKSLPEILVERRLAKNIHFNPLAKLTHKIATAHQQIRIANEIIAKREDEEGMMM